MWRRLSHSGFFFSGVHEIFILLSEGNIVAVCFELEIYSHHHDCDGLLCQEHDTNIMSHHRRRPVKFTCFHKRPARAGEIKTTRTSVHQNISD